MGWSAACEQIERQRSIRASLDPVDMMGANVTSTARFGAKRGHEQCSPGPRSEAALRVLPLVNLGLHARLPVSPGV